MMKRAAIPFFLFAWFILGLFAAVGQSDQPSAEPEIVQAETPIVEDVSENQEPMRDEAQMTLSVDPDEEDSFPVDLSGRKTWTVRYGVGNPVGLAASGLVPGQMTLDQSLSVDVVGEALSVLTIEAHYNDQLSQAMQSLALYLDTERLDGVLGDFTFGSIPDFTAYSKKMKGLQLEYLLGDAVITAVVSKTEGVSETAVFVGQTAHAEIEYSVYSQSESEDPAPYRVHLNGLSSFVLQSLYTEAFSSVYAQFAVSPNLRNVLNQYEIGYLYDAVLDEPQLELRTQNYRVLDLDEQVLLLQRDPLLLVREWLRELIDVYNDKIAPEDSDSKSYPFTAGTDYELGFLGAIAPSARLVVDDTVYPVNSAQCRRFYDLGHEEVRESSVIVKISRDGEIFDSLPSSRLSEYEITVHASAGVLECNFPDTFYTTTSMLRVAMDYVVTDGVFMLGLSMIPDSERVTLNSVLLERDVDYSLDYEVGMLFMLVELTDTDVLQVDYELYSGGFGATSDYASYFYGLTLDLPISDWLTLQANVLQLAEVLGSASNPDRISTMPNRHTVAGIQADLSMEDFRASALVGYNEDRFPVEDNARIMGANQVNAVAAGDGYVLFGHRSGVTVYDAGRWVTYGLESGLSSRVIQALAISDGVAYIGTSAGLTVVHLDGASPFDRAANWTRYFEDDGLPNASVTAILVHDDDVWIGTRRGIISLPVDELPSLDSWTQYQSDVFELLPPITSLVADDNTLYVGTEAGVYAYEVQADQLRFIAGTDGVWVNDLELVNRTLYVASNRGLRGFRNGVGTGWLVLGDLVTSLAAVEGSLYYGTESGLVELAGNGTEKHLEGSAITALATSDDGLWISTKADESSALIVWQLTHRLRAYPESITGISGLDPYAFTDSLASEHTVTGWVTRASFHQSADGYSLSGRVDAVPSTFRAIGSSRRADSTGWTLSGDFSLGREGTLRVDHDYRLSNQLGETPSDRMSNGLSLDWSATGGPDWQASIRQVEANNTDALGDRNTREISLSISTTETFFRDALQLGLSWDRFSFASDRWEEEWQREEISLSGDWQLTDTLSTSGSWARPVRFADESISGSERLAWNWAWVSSIGFAGLSVDYSTDWARTLFEDRGTWSHEAVVRFDGESFQSHGWDISPDLKLEAAVKNAEADVHAELVLRSDIDDFTLRSTLRGHLTELGRPVHNRAGELSLNAKYSGFSDLDLSMTYTGSRSAAIMADAVAPASSDSLIGRLTWSPEDGPRDDLSFSLSIKQSEASKQVTATVDNGLTLNLAPRLTRWLELEDRILAAGYPIADLRLDSKAEYRRGTSDPEFTFSTSARVLAAIAARWNVSFAATCQVGHKSTLGLYSSLALEITFAIDF